jgi:hydrogenase maturation protease
LETLIVGGHGDIVTRNVLVIGYGNTLRGDDAVGQHVAQGVSSWNSPGLTSIAVQQLSPELAEPLSRADLAIFVDAKIADDGDLVDIQQLEGSNVAESIGHTSDPRRLLTLASAIFGRQPAAWLVSVQAANFSVHDGLSGSASRGALLALERIAKLIGA